MTDYTLTAAQPDVLADVPLAEGEFMRANGARVFTLAQPAAKLAGSAAPEAQGSVVEWCLCVRVVDGGGPLHWPGNVNVRATAADDPGAFAAPVPPPPPEIMPVTVADVRAETERRLMLAFGARDAQHLNIKVQDSMIRANQLTDRLVQGDTLSAEDEAVAAYLRQAVRVYFAIKATGNAYEQAAAAGAIRPDWRNNANWPLVGEAA